MKVLIEGIGSILRHNYDLIGYKLIDWDDMKVINFDNHEMIIRYKYESGRSYQTGPKKGTDIPGLKSKIRNLILGRGHKIDDKYYVFNLKNIVNNAKTITVQLNFTTFISTYFDIMHRDIKLAILTMIYEINNFDDAVKGFDIDTSPNDIRYLIHKKYPEIYELMGVIDVIKDVSYDDYSLLLCIQNHWSDGAPIIDTLKTYVVWPEYQMAHPGVAMAKLMIYLNNMTIYDIVSKDDFLKRNFIPIFLDACDQSLSYIWRTIDYNDFWTIYDDLTMGGEDGNVYQDMIYETKCAQIKLFTHHVQQFITTSQVNITDDLFPLEWKLFKESPIFWVFILYLSKQKLNSEWVDDIARQLTIYDNLGKSGWYPSYGSYGFDIIIPDDYSFVDTFLKSMLT